MIVTTGGRVTLSPWGFLDMREQRAPSAVISLALTTMTEFLGDQCGGVVVDLWVMVAITPILNSAFTTSPPFSASFCARSATVMVSQSPPHGDRCRWLEKPLRRRRKRACSRWRLGLVLPRAPVVRRAFLGTGATGRRSGWRVVVHDTTIACERGSCAFARCGRPRAAPPALDAWDDRDHARLACAAAELFIRRCKCGLCGCAGFLGFLAGSFLGLEARALDFFGAALVDFGELLLLGEVALLGFLQLAQDLGTLIGHRFARLLGWLDQRDLLAHDDVDSRLALAAADGQFFLAAAVERDLLRRLAGLGGIRLAVRALQEAKQLDLLDAGHDLVGAAEAHAGLGQLLQQLLDRRVHQFSELADGGLLRHSFRILVARDVSCA
jgi:hypothetical protein